MRKYSMRPVLQNTRNGAGLFKGREVSPTCPSRQVQYWDEVARGGFVE